MPPPVQVPTTHMFDMARRQEAIAQAQAAKANGASGTSAPAKPRPLAPDELKDVGRNDPCPCGSGQKFKACHGKAS